MCWFLLFVGKITHMGFPDFFSTAALPLRAALRSYSRGSGTFQSSMGYRKGECSRKDILEIFGLHEWK